MIDMIVHSQTGMYTRSVSLIDNILTSNNYYTCLCMCRKIPTIILQLNLTATIKITLTSSNIIDRLHNVMHDSNINKDH